MSLIEGIAPENLSDQSSNELQDAISIYEQSLAEMREVLDDQVRTMVNNPKLEGK